MYFLLQIHFGWLLEAYALPHTNTHTHTHAHTNTHTHTHTHTLSLSLSLSSRFPYLPFPHPIIVTHTPSLSFNRSAHTHTHTLYIDGVSTPKYFFLTVWYSLCLEGAEALVNDAPNNLSWCIAMVSEIATTFLQVCASRRKFLCVCVCVCV